jgi:hypothetical protein
MLSSEILQKSSGVSKEHDLFIFRDKGKPSRQSQAASGVLALAARET